MTQCLVCGTTLNLQSHHITPVSLGGPEDGPQVPLCGNCHSNIHKMAESLRTKAVQQGAIPPMLFNKEEFERAKPLIQAILTAHTSFESLAQSNEPRRRMFVLHIGDADWARLHKAKADAGFTSMTKYLTNLLLNQVRKQ